MLEGVDSNSSIGYATVFQRSGNDFLTQSGDKVSDKLNQLAMDEQYDLIWSDNLTLTRGIHVSVGKPVNRVFVITVDTQIQVFQTIFDKLGQ